MKNRIESDEIDLIEVIINIWSQKSKIAAITAIFIVLSVALYFVFKPPLNAKTEILPITIFEESSYSQYNLMIKNLNENKNEDANLNLDQINKIYLLNFFLEELQTKETIIEAIKNYQLINRKKFNNEDEYLEEVEKYVLSLDLLRPVNVNGKKRDETRLNSIIGFKVYDKNKWEEALNFVESKTNRKIQKYLKDNFNKTLNNLKLLEQLKLEDLELKIKNVKEDYEDETANRLVFLREQALIAKELNISENTIDVESFVTSSGAKISVTQTVAPYYMRGYPMIEKEIELIQTRTDKDKSAFIENLLDLEKQKRVLLDDKSLERIEELFNATPVVNDNNFKAGSIIYKDTNYEVSISLIKVILFAGTLGIIFGMFYFSILNAIKQRK